MEEVHFNEPHARLVNQQAMMSQLISVLQSKIFVYIHFQGDRMLVSKPALGALHDIFTFTHQTISLILEYFRIIVQL